MQYAGTAGDAKGAWACNQGNSSVCLLLLSVTSCQQSCYQFEEFLKHCGALVGLAAALLAQSDHTIIWTLEKKDHTLKSAVIYMLSR